VIGVVLLQQGKSADLAGAFGGQGSQTAFGPRGAANLLTKGHYLGRHPLHVYLHRAYVLIQRKQWLTFGAFGHQDRAYYPAKPAPPPNKAR